MYHEVYKTYVDEKGEQYVPIEALFETGHEDRRLRRKTHHRQSDTEYYKKRDARSRSPEYSRYRRRDDYSREHFDRRDRQHRHERHERRERHQEQRHERHRGDHRQDRRENRRDDRDRRCDRYRDQDDRYDRRYDHRDYHEDHRDDDRRNRRRYDHDSSPQNHYRQNEDQRNFYKTDDRHGRYDRREHSSAYEGRHSHRYESRYRNSTRNQIEDRYQRDDSTNRRRVRKENDRRHSSRYRSSNDRKRDPEEEWYSYTTKRIPSNPPRRKRRSRSRSPTNRRRHSSPSSSSGHSLSPRRNSSPFSKQKSKEKPKRRFYQRSNPEEREDIDPSIAMKTSVRSRIIPAFDENGPIHIPDISTQERRSFKTLKLPREIWTMRSFDFLRGSDIFRLTSVHRNLDAIKMFDGNNDDVARYLLDRDFPFVYDIVPNDDLRNHEPAQNPQDERNWLEAYFYPDNLLQTYAELSRAQTHPYFRYFANSPESIVFGEETFTKFAYHLENTDVGVLARMSWNIPLYLFFHPNRDEWDIPRQLHYTNTDMYRSTRIHEDIYGSCCFYTTGHAVSNWTNEIEKQEVLVNVDSETAIRLPRVVKMLAVKLAFCCQRKCPKKSTWNRWNTIDKQRFGELCSHYYDHGNWNETVVRKAIFSRSKVDMQRQVESCLHRLVHLISGVNEYSNYRGDVYFEFIADQRKSVVADIGKDEDRSFVKHGALEYGVSVAYAEYSRKYFDRGDEMKVEDEEDEDEDEVSEDEDLELDMEVVVRQRLKRSGMSEPRSEDMF